MRKSVKNMTQGSPVSLIFFFSLPLMIGNIFQQLYTTIDSIIVGRFVGVSALAAIGASDWIYWMILWSIHGLTQGFGILIAQDFGSDNKKRLREIICSVISLAVLFSILLTVIPLAMISPVLTLLHTPPAIFSETQLYLRILFGGNAVVIAFNTSSSILRSLGNSKLPLLAMVIAALTNIALDLLFVVKFQFGIAGAAAATLLAQFLAFLICLFPLLHLPLIHPTYADWRACSRHFMRLCRFSIPLAVQNSIIALGGMFVQNVLNGLGVSFVAAVTAANKINGILESIATALGYGLGTFIAQNYGAGKTARIHAGLRVSVALSALFAVCISVFCIIIGKNIIGLFLSNSENNFQTILALSYQYLKILCTGLFILFLVHLYRNALQSLGNTIGPVLSGITELVTRMIGAIAFPFLWGQTGIFYCEVFAWIGTAVVLMFAYYFVVHQRKHIMS